MPEITVHKADAGLSETPVQAVTIHITQELDHTHSKESIHDWYAVYQADAEAIAEALANSLPQGTRVRLVAELLKKEAQTSGFRGL